MYVDGFDVLAIDGVLTISIIHYFYVLYCLSQVF